MDLINTCKEKMRRMKERLWNAVFYIKLFEILVMMLSVGLAMDSVANGAVAKWQAIEIVFIFNFIYICINTISLVYHTTSKRIPSTLLLASPIIGAAAFTFAGRYTFDFWKGLNTILSHEKDPASCIVRGIHQLRLVSNLCSNLPALLAVDGILCILSRPSDPAPKPKEIMPYRAPPYQLPRGPPRFQRLTL